MTQERYHSFNQLNLPSKLTEAEIEEGWHFCPDWDGLLIGPKTPEFDNCTCGLRESSEYIMLLP